MQEILLRLASLPFDLRFHPTKHPKDDLLIFHGNPRSNEEMILPPEDVQFELWGEVRQPDNDPVLKNLFEGITAETVAFGHFHFANIRNWHQKKFVNVASVSLPAFNKTPHARYSILTWIDSRWEVKQILVDYDYHQELDPLPECGLPNWADYAKGFPG